eukprot:CAMPEP_0174724786 /NCGR_PEP_ID=MMETSP1094-20130205/44147_1 /TAXON_ID=156173 /ORGANISM="Chrysochromulina brevifilum, Strain UTEX LB 985" /LENGTH=74 /DNA_ID=CAMNT_0015926061 /DNA_START=81 /DNA_END=305 /DNA_ORIENTATION=-
MTKGDVAADPFHEAQDHLSTVLGPLDNESSAKADTVSALGDGDGKVVDDGEGGGGGGESESFNRSRPMVVVSTL